MISRPGIEDALCCNSVRLSFPAGASPGCRRLGTGLADMAGIPGLTEGEAAGLSAWVGEGDLEGALGDGTGAGG
jgi:hypothetical protein